MGVVGLGARRCETRAKKLGNNTKVQRHAPGLFVTHLFSCAWVIVLCRMGPLTGPCFPRLPTPRRWMDPAKRSATTHSELSSLTNTNDGEISAPTAVPQMSLSVSRVAPWRENWRRGTCSVGRVCLGQREVLSPTTASPSTLAVVLCSILRHNLPPSKSQTQSSVLRPGQTLEGV